MADNKLTDYSVHVHFHGKPTPEFIEALNRMLEVASKEFDDKISNGNTEKRESKSVCLCCDGLGTCEDVNNEVSTCMICNGSGHTGLSSERY